MMTNYIKDLLINNIKTYYFSSFINDKKDMIEKTDVNTSFKSYLKISSEDFNFNNCSLTFINDDLAYILNEKKILYKLYILNENKNKYNIIETNDKLLNDDDDMFLFALEKEYLFGFNYNEFGKTKKSIKLLKTEHNNNNINLVIEMDEKSKNIFNECVIKSKEKINELYLNLFSFDENEKAQFLNEYSPNSEVNSTNVILFQYNSYLFIIHPIYKKVTNNNKNSDSQANNNLYKNYYFSQKNIYAIDHFEVFLNQNNIKENDKSILYINFKSSFILKKPFDEIDEEVKKNRNIINI
jgi:hypothetical protein